jgi:tetratricopeptide (TPR) repeat protein
MSTQTCFIFILLNASRLGLALLITATFGCNRRPLEPEGALAEARQTLQAGDYATARDMLLQVCDEQPQSLTAQVNLAMAYWRIGDVTAAAAALNRATEIAPQNADIWALRAHLLVQTGNPEGAIEVLDNISNPDAATLTLRSLAYQLSGNPDRALYHLEQALKQDRYYPPALHNLAILQRDHFDAPIEAMAAWRRFRETAPQSPRAARTDEEFLGEQVSQPPAAVSMPAGSGPVETITTPPSEPQPPTAAPAQARPTPAPAETITELQSPPPGTAATAPASTPAKPPSSAKALIAKANSEIAAGNNDSALVVLKDAVQRFPDNADAVWALAVFYDKQLGIKDRAEGLYKTFMTMFPDDPRAKSLRTASAPPPPKPSTPAPATPSPDFFQKGLEHYSRQEWDQAIAAYRQALSMDPRSESCAYNLGLAYKAKNDLDAAAAAFRHAIDIQPDMVKSLYMLGLTEIQRKRNADALAHLNRLIRIQPDFAKAHYLLGTVYQTENRPDTAAHHFARFLELDPNDKAAPQVKRWLEQHRR